ncbi:MAG TPA: AsmA family protein [Hyphomicrobiaceae bacterium]|nr:AsmA family protein [Hyphomicrobiaceae bacterium]
MNSVLLWLGGLLVAALALLFAVPHAIDWNAYRGVFEEEASRLLGREVRVGGEVNLRLLPMPYVRFEKVRIAEADGSLGEPFFRAEAFTLWLAVPPLLKGIIEANQVELDRPVLRLALNERGQGNWQTFRFSPGLLPFVPNDVAFRSVAIRGGTLLVRTSGAAGTSSLTDVNGEFSASALEGPYKFRGNALWNGAPREIRLSTSAFEPDGRLRFKLTIHVYANGNAYTLDGTLSDLARAVRVEGDLTAQLRLAATGAGRTGEPTVFDLRSSLAADGRGARLGDLSLSYERDGKPQLLNGEARVSWQTRLELAARLTSRWLDLDRIAGRASDVSPLESARALAQGMAELVPSEGTARATLDVEQAQLGGETVSGLRVGLERSGGALKVQEFRAALPGNARLNLKGTIVGDDARAFNGDLMLRGVSLGRFLAWAAPGTPGETPAGEGPFWLASELSLSPAHIELSKASAELGGAQIEGSLRYRWEGGSELALALDGASIDLSAVVPGLLSEGRLAAMLWPASRSATYPQSVRLRVRADEVVDGGTRFTDVDADILLSGGTLRLPVLKFTSPDGLRVEMQGDVNDAAGRASGALRGFVSAPTAEAVAALGGLMGSAPPLPARLLPSGVSSFDLAFTAAFGDRAGSRLTIRSDGMVQQSRATATILLDGGLAGWRAAPIDATLKLEGPDVIPLLVGSLSGPRDPSPPSEASFALKVSGSSAASLVTFAEIESGEDRLTFRGQSGLDAAGALGVSGELLLAVADLGEAQPLMQWRRRLRLAGISVAGLVDIAAKGGTVRLEPRGLMVGKSKLTGLLTLASGEPNLHIEGRLRASEAPLQGLLGLLVDGRARDGEIQAGDASPWPDAPFAFDNLEGIEGKLVLSLGALQIGEGTALSEAELAVELSPGRVDVAKLEGRALGGRLASRLTLERAAAGADLSFSGRLDGLQLEQLGPRRGGEPQSRGIVNLSLDLQGRALSPRGLLAVATGKGTAEIIDGYVSGISAGAVDKAADAVLAGATEGGRSTLERELQLALQASALAIGTRRIPLEVADGAVRVGALTVDGPDGRVRNETTIDLQELRVDSEWQITPKRSAARSPAGRPQLPGVSLVYVGPLASLGTLKPRLSLDSLERELMVRRMEREVEQLERLRREDEERIRLQNAAPPEAGDPPVLEAPFPIAPQAAPGSGAGSSRRRQSVAPPVPEPPVFPGSGVFNQSR